MSAPVVGDYIRTERLGLVQVTEIHAFGTYDVRAASDRYFRVSGLAGATWHAQAFVHAQPGSNFEPTIFKSSHALTEGDAT